MSHPTTALVAVAAVLLSGCSTSEPADRSEPTSPAPSVSSATPRADAEPRESGQELSDQLAQSLEDGPRWARNPGQVADQIVAAERAIADPGTRPEVLRAAGRLQQVAYVKLGTRPGWDQQVRAALPDNLVGRMNANVASRREFRSMHPDKPSDELPAWRIVRPAPANTLLAAYREAERRFGVDWEFLAAINLVETGMGRIRGTSVAGAKGPMQFIDETWARYGQGDVNSPRDAILAAGRYLSARGFADPGGKADALYSYNNHPAYVRGVTHLANVMQRHPRAFHGYYHWQVRYLTTRGSIELPVGYRAAEPIPVDRWLARQ